jgi:hypothetical protein
VDDKEFIDAQLLVKKVMGSLNIDTDSDKRYQMISHWDEIIGEKFVGHITLKEIKGDTLVVRADHPAWSQLFSMQQGKIISKVRKEYPSLGIRKILLLS